MERHTPVILEGDCLERLADLRPAGVHLAYLDPPFNSGTDRTAERGRFDDRWPSLDAYLEFIGDRLDAVLRVLHPDGSLLVHCDWRTCHHLRLLIESRLGPDSFVNHLIWHYGLGGSSPRRFARKHDDILFHARSPRYYFDPPRVPATSQRLRGELKKATDVLDIPALNNMARERCGYPTQKPVALLRLLVDACAPPGGLVLDPFCGSGTTLIAAADTGRRAIGIDVNPEAVRVANERLAARRSAREAADESIQQQPPPA